MAQKILPETGYMSLAAEFAIADIEAAAQADELFGAEDCTDEEAEIIFSTNLTHSEKLAALFVLRNQQVQ